METPTRIGTRLVLTPLANHEGNRWSAESPELPSGWKCQLLHRGEGTLVPGHALTGWVLEVDNDQREVLASDSNFGFLPVSDRMRPRYVAALRHFGGLLDQVIAVRDADPSAISEVKGMFSRSARRDQWDWFDVHVALKEPSRHVASERAEEVQAIARALRAGDFMEAATLLALFRAGPAGSTIQVAAESIQEAGPKISGMRPISGPRRPAPTEKAVHAVLSEYSKEKLDSANATHKELLVVLGEVLALDGHRVEANQYIDAFTRLKTGPALFEAKSLTESNELSQVRQAVSQLYEYRFRHQLEEASLWLLLSRPLIETWLLDYLEKDRGINVLWVVDGELAGPACERLRESGSAEMRRRARA